MIGTIFSTFNKFLSIEILKLNIFYFGNIFYLKNVKFQRLKRKANDAVLERVGEKSTLIDIEKDNFNL